MNDPLDAIYAVRSAWRTVRAMPATQLLLRFAMLVVGLVGFLLPGQPLASTSGVVMIVAALTLVVAVVLPGGAGPAGVLALMVLAWLLAFGLHDMPPLWRTYLLGADLYLLHSLATLCAAMPAAARVEPRLLLRWGSHTGVALVLGGGVAGAAYATGRLPGSLPLEIAGLAGVVALVAVPVLLVRGRGAS